jgi:hypothetical protein
MENKEENTSWMTNTPLARKLALSVNLPGKGKSKATAPRENTSRPASPNMESGTPSVDPSTVGATPKGGRRLRPKTRKTRKNRKTRNNRKSRKY